jgi:Spy/CpxP family protein refolding chaperone
MMGGRFLMGSFRGLDLTPAQREQVHTVLSTARQQHENKRPGAAGGPDMMALANPGDPNYATALQAAKKRAADRIQEFSELQQKLYNVLTPQQKTQLTKNVAERKAKMAQWKAKMEQWKAERAKGQQGNGRQGATGNE